MGSLLSHGAASTTSPTQDVAHIATGFLGSVASSHLPSYMNTHIGFVRRAFRLAEHSHGSP